MARFAKPVTIESKRGVEEAAAVLRPVTRLPLERGNKGAVFVGKVEHDGGRIWFHRRRDLRPPARSLKFRLVPTAEGCRLDGELSVTAPLRIFVLSYLLFCCIGGPVFAVCSYLHGGSLWLVLRYLLQAAVGGLIFVYGYTGLAILVSRGPERLGLKVLRHLLADDLSTAVTLDLLTLSR